MTPRDRAAQIAAVAALDQSVRRDLYAFITAKGDWVGRDDTAEALGLARSVAAFHLDKLTEAGLLQVRYERPAGRRGPGAGRPAKLYCRADTEISVSLPERNYDLAAALLSDAVLASTGTDCPVNQALATAARTAGAEAGTTARADLPRRRSAKAIRQAAVRALRELGYEPREQKGEIVLANCPFHRLAERHRSLICGMNLDLLTGLVEGIEAQDRLEARLQPTPGMCCVRMRTT